MTAPPQEAAKPLRLSWSRIREHEECPEKAWQHHVAKTRSPVADIRVFFRGTVVDRCMRRWLESDDPQPGQMAAMVDNIIETEERTAREEGDGVVRWKHASDKDEVRAWCRDLVTRLEPVLYEHVIPFEYQPAVRFEQALTIPGLDGSPVVIILTGEMDILVRWPDQRRIVYDLKGTADDQYWRKVLGQLVFYEIASWGMTQGQWPAKSGLIQPMCTQPIIEFNFLDEHRMDMFGRIVKVAHEIWRGHHPPKAGNAGCSTCFARLPCSKFAAIPGSKRVAIGM